MCVQGFLSTTTAKKEPTSFLSGFDTLLRVNKDPLLPIVEEATTLCIQMCIADAMHDSKIIENVKNLQSKSLLMLNQLSEQIQNITDRASVEHCKRVCMKVIEEVERDVLAVETEVVSNTSASSRSTVNCNFESTISFFDLHQAYVGGWRDASLACHFLLTDWHIAVWGDHRQHNHWRTSI